MKYALKGRRQGFDLGEMGRIDLPANANGHLYSELRSKSGEVKAVVLTSLIMESL